MKRVFFSSLHLLAFVFFVLFFIPSMAYSTQRVALIDYLENVIFGIFFENFYLYYFAAIDWKQFFFRWPLGSMSINEIEIQYHSRVVI